MNAVMNVMMTIWQSKIMTLGVVCEILAVIAAALSSPVIPTPGWLPYAALLMATIGAAIVAGKVAWDYHSRGLNATQRNDVQGIMASASLNPTQLDEVAEAIKLSGLTERQKSELEAALMAIDVVNVVFTQKAVADALNYLWKSDHGHVVVIHTIGFGLFDVQYVVPPWPKSVCEREHSYEENIDIDYLEVAKSLLQSSTSPAVLWKHPANQQVRHTNRASRGSSRNEIVFNPYDCVPEWRVPAIGDYVLTHDRPGGSASIWVKKV